MNLKKRFENFWYYYKIPFIIILVALYVLTNVVVTKITEVNYDNSIAIISKDSYPSEEKIEQLRSIFEEKYGGTFDVIIYNISLGEMNQDEVTISKLDLDLRNKISTYFFIEDLETFKETTANIEFSEVSLVNDNDWLSGLDLDNFYFAIRK